MSSLWRILAVAWLGGVGSANLSTDGALAESLDPSSGAARAPRQIVALAADSIDGGLGGKLDAVVRPDLDKQEQRKET